MRILGRCFAMLAAWVLLGAATAPAPASGQTVVVPLEGDVSKAQFYFLRRALKQAEASGASAVVLRMDTYGGALDAAVDIIDALQRTSLPTYTFIDGNAGSAGALIALGTKHIYMSPISAIGAAAPVLGGGQELPPTASEKTISYFSKYFRSAAEQNGHNPEVAEAFIDKRKEVKIGEKVISEKDSLLSLSSTEAAAIYDGKPLLAAGIVDSVEQLVEKAGLPPDIVVAEPTGFEQAAFWITALAPIFLLIGIGGAYLELQAPGFGVAGICSIVGFGLFFFGHYVAGLAGMEVFILFVLGAALIIAELLLFPGTLVAGVIGAILMLGSLVWAMMDRYPSQGLALSPEMLAAPLLNLAIAVGGTFVVGMVLARYLPRVPFFNHLMLATSNPPGASLRTPTAGAIAGGQAEDLIGREGVALSPLRPSGKIRSGDRLIDVVSEGVFLDKGSRVRISAVEGSRIVVEPIEESRQPQ